MQFPLGRFALLFIVGLSSNSRGLTRIERWRRIIVVVFFGSRSFRGRTEIERWRRIIDLLFFLWALERS